MSTRLVLGGDEVERVRVGLERDLLARLNRELGELTPTVRDFEEVRREWLWAHQELPEDAHARVTRLAALAREGLGVARPVRVYQKAGPAHHLNAITHRASQGPILVQLHGDVLGRLDDGGVVAVLGHEIGHHLAHGPLSLRGVDPFFLHWRLLRGRRAGYRELAAAYCRAAELTADRFGLLACRDVDAVVRMDISLMPASAREADAGAQLGRSIEYAEGLLKRRCRAQGDSHPEGAVRIYATWLFAESDLYRELTGLGPGTRPIAEVDRALARLVGPSESAEDMGLPAQETPLIDRAREAVGAAHERTRARAVATAQRVMTMAMLVAGAQKIGPGELPPGAGGADLGEVDRDPLEEKFAELERRVVREAAAELERRTAAALDPELERRFAELERRGGTK